MSKATTNEIAEPRDRFRSKWNLKVSFIRSNYYASKYVKSLYYVKGKRNFRMTDRDHFLRFTYFNGETRENVKIFFPYHTAIKDIVKSRRFVISKRMGKLVIALKGPLTT